MKNSIKQVWRMVRLVRATFEKVLDCNTMSWSLFGVDLGKLPNTQSTCCGVIESHGIDHEHRHRRSIVHAPIIFLILILSGCGWSKTDKALLFASCAATYADYHTSTRLFDDGGYEAFNPIAGEHPSNSELATVLITSEVLVITAAWLLPKYRTAILSGKTIINTGFAISNSQK